MVRFNTKSEGSTKTVNLAGGEAYFQTPELEFVSILLTSFLNDKFYRKANDEMDRLVTLIGQIKDKEFLGKAAVYTRNEFGMRSITHVLTAELVNIVSGANWLRPVIKNVIRRPDDGIEILAYYINKFGKNKLKKVLRRGISDAFGKFNEYTLAKYRCEERDIKLIDLVRLCHVEATAKNKVALEKLVKGTLKPENTWEAKLSEAGRDAENEEEVIENKKEAWADLIKSGKIGYFALLRNLRNILEQSPDVMPEATQLLVNEEAIKRSLVLPFRFSTAYDEIKVMSGANQVLGAISRALDISVNNCPELSGKTLVVLDTSGSMETAMSGSKTAKEIGALFAATILKRNPSADFMMFSDDAHYASINPTDSIMSIMNSIHYKSGGTNFNSIFERTDKKYDRIIILSDMQGWVGYNVPTATFNRYKTQFNCNPTVYSFDLCGHGTMQFPENNVYTLAGFSDKIFDIMKLLETDKNALINTIKNYEIK